PPLAVEDTDVIQGGGIGSHTGKLPELGGAVGGPVEAVGRSDRALAAVGDEREQHARVVGATARDLQDAGAARAHGVDVRVGGRLDVEADPVAGAEDVGGRPELDVVLDDFAGRHALVRGERVP